MLNIPNECLDATLLAATQYDKDGFMVMCCGDGVIVIKTKEKETIIIDTAYTDSYPFYINYIYDATGRYLNWKENHDNRKITQTVLGILLQLGFASLFSAVAYLFLTYFFHLKEPKLIWQSIITQFKK